MTATWKRLSIPFIITFLIPSLAHKPPDGISYNTNQNSFSGIFENYIDSTLKSSQQNHQEDFFGNYDFIIIGSGSSGAIIANRLSEVESWKILLLEAGNRGNFLTQIPVFAPIFQLTPYSWNYTMEHEKGVCLSMEEQICSWPKGKAVGGSTIINYMIYARGNPQDYNNWAKLGNDEWSYKKVLPYFLKSENCNLGSELCSGPYHNTDGYLSINYPFKSEITDAFLQAGIELGEKIVDYNTPNFMGFSQIQATIKNGRRHSTADAFLYPLEGFRKNLRILTGARVLKILIEPATNKTYGVVFRKNGKTYVATSTKEVILSAGAFNSPQLLMLSGVGPQEHLKNLNIPLIKNLPVGELLYDHIAYLGLAFTINQTIEPKDALLNPRELINWIFKGKGAYTSLAGVEALGYINTGSIPDPNYPDMELLFAGTGSLESDFGFVVARETRIRKEIYDAVFKPLEQTPAWSIIPMLLHPKSRGYLKLRSNNPYDAPLMHGNYFTDSKEKDLGALLASIRYIQKLSKTAAFQKYNSQLHNIPIPGCEIYPFDSDEYWKCALRSLTSTLHHQMSTCKMGPASDGEAVVNPRLKVYGVEGLRVADSSVFPATVSAHISAPTMMIGEKASDMIKEDWNAL